MKNSETLPKEHIFKSLQECATYGKVGRQAIYIAIKLKKLKAVKYNGNWIIMLKDYDEYRLNKFNRDLTAVKDGIPIYNAEQGIFSPNQARQILSTLLGRPFPKNKIYYEIRRGKIQCHRHGSAYIIHKEALIQYVQEKQENKEQTFFA